MQNYVFLFKYKYDLKNFILCYIIRLKSMILTETNITDWYTQRKRHTIKSKRICLEKVSMSTERIVIRIFAYEWPHNLPHNRLYHDHNVCKTQEEILNKWKILHRVWFHWQICYTFVSDLWKHTCYGKIRILFWDQ